MTNANTGLAQDFVQRFLLDDLDIHGAHVRMTVSWQRMRANRNYPQAVMQCVGEMAAVTALVGDRLKEAGKLSFQMRGNGKVPMIVVDNHVALFCNDALNLGLPEAAQHGPDFLGIGREVVGDWPGFENPYCFFVKQPREQCGSIEAMQFLAAHGMCQLHDT